MREFTIRLSDEEYEALATAAKLENETPEQKAVSVLHTMLVRPHNMNEESMKKGYEEAGEVNLEWAGLK